MLRKQKKKSKINEITRIKNAVENLQHLPFSHIKLMFHSSN